MISPLAIGGIVIAAILAVVLIKAAMKYFGTSSSSGGDSCDDDPEQTSLLGGGDGDHEEDDDGPDAARLLHETYPPYYPPATQTYLRPEQPADIKASVEGPMEVFSKHPLEVRVKESVLDTDTHVMKVRPRRVTVHSTKKYDQRFAKEGQTGAWLSGYDSDTGVLRVPVGLYNVVGVEMHKFANKAHAFWFPGGTIQWSEGVTGPYFVVLSEGQKTAAGLAAEIQTTMQGDDANMTVTYNATTERFDFSTTTSSFAMIALTSELASAIGFSGANVAQNSTTAGPTYTHSTANKVDLLPGLFIHVTCDDLREGYQNTNLIETMHIVDSVNVDGTKARPRMFSKPMEHVRTLDIKLNVMKNDGKMEAYDPHGRSFEMVLDVFVQQMEEIQRAKLYG